MKYGANSGAAECSEGARVSTPQSLRDHQSHYKSVRLEWNKNRRPALNGKRFALARFCGGKRKLKRTKKNVKKAVGE